MSTGWKEQRVSHWFARAWAEQFARVLGGGDEESSDLPRLEPGDPRADVWGEWQNPVWYSVQSDAVSDAAFFVGCAQDTAKALLAHVGAVDESSTETVLDEYPRRIEQALAALSPEIERNTGKTAEFSEAGSCSAPEQLELGVEYQVNLAGVVHLLALVPSAGMVSGLLDAMPPAAARPDAETETEPSVGGPDNDSLPKPGESGLPTSRNLEVLLDVDLDLSVSFGKTELVLEDVLQLSSGSIVELNRSANDPVDVLVNNSIVARGEVVVVDGNYGIRVTEVVSRKERIRSVL